MTTQSHPSSKPCNFPVTVVAAFLAVLLWCSGGAVAEGAENQSSSSLTTENVLLITIDGLRWQELFGGADEILMNKEFGGVRDLPDLKERFWRADASDRRRTLMPFFWDEIAVKGRIYGDPDLGSSVHTANPHWFSYPGYNEILTGIADPKIDSNDKQPNPHVTVLEWLNRRDPFRGRVAAFCSWDVFPYIINAERSGIPVNAGWHSLNDTGDDADLAALDKFAEELPHYWDNVRYDYFTFRGALQAIQKSQPRVLYVSFGETDDWAHAGRYDLYLDAAWRTDRYIRTLWESMQALPQYAGKTSLVLTTDHGRGETRVDWKSHGDDVPGSSQMWIAVMGPDTPAGPVEETAVTQSQTAATVAELLGLDFRRDSPASAAPLPGAVKPAP